MRVFGQTVSDDTERLLVGSGSVDLAPDGEVWVNVGIPPKTTLKLRWNRDERYWTCYAPLHDPQAGNHWLSLIIMDD